MKERASWKKRLVLLLACVGLSVSGCQCLVLVPPVQYPDLGKNPPKNVPLPDKKDPPAECAVEAKPAKVEFELTAVGKSRRETIEITNVGQRTCELSTIRIVGRTPQGTQAFFLADNISFPYLLMEGKSLKFEVLFRPPVQSTKFMGILIAESSGPFAPRATVELHGISEGPCLTIKPPQLQMGDTQLSCTTRTRFVELSLDKKEHCPETVNITRVAFTPQTSDEFSLKEKPELPLKLARGSTVKIGVVYLAKNLGLDQGQLEIDVDRPAKTYTVPVEGRGVPDASQTDTFVQKERSVVDILFVVDSSCSMGDEQDSLANNFNSFIRWAIQLKADYHIGVTTTDTTNRRFQAGCLQGNSNSKIISPKTPNPIQAFSLNVRVGTRGSSSERGLEAAYQALHPNQQKGCNKGFYRESALLSLVFVSDEPDQSRNSVDFYLKFFRDLKGSDVERLLRASAIVGPERTGCATQYGSAGPAPRYRQVARALKGVTASICTSAWANTLNQIGLASFGRQSVFTLSRTATPSSIVVKIDGKVAPRDPVNGWRFEASNNTVIFAKTFIPNVGSVVTISYQVACQP